MAYFECVKCGSNDYETDEITTTGSTFSKFFNIQNRKYQAITCRNCNFTEFYKGTTSTLGNIIDFFGN